MSFLSTPPSRVATVSVRHDAAPASVSIHATLAGGDGCFRYYTFSGKGFYPRHPRGWRPRTFRRYNGIFRFLSTPPSRVATPTGAVGCISGTCFYPRHPRGWRPSSRWAWGSPTRVSIHATLAGGDGLPASGSNGRGWFLSTPPSRVATRVFVNTPPCNLEVSIHATLAGGDHGNPGRVCWDAGFYPRHPRGWRRSVVCAF